MIPDNQYPCELKAYQTRHFGPEKDILWGQPYGIELKYIFDKLHTGNNAKIIKTTQAASPRGNYDIYTEVKKNGALKYKFICELDLECVFSNLLTFIEQERRQGR